MAHILLVESRDPYESLDSRRTFELAKNLAANHDEVTLLLVESGVLPTRESALTAELLALGRAGVRVLADVFALRERGITRPVGAVATSLDVVIDHLSAGHKVLWH